MRKVRVLCVTAAALATTALAASADPIPITSGLFNIGGFARGAFRSSGFTLMGPDSFSIAGNNPDGDPQPVPPCSQFGPCTAGATTTASNTYFIDGSVGPGTVNGTSYSTLVYHGGHFTFTSDDMVLPPTTADTFQVRAPFLFQGVASIWSADTGPTQMFVGDLSLTGHGTAIASLERFGSGYALSGFTYEFEKGTTSPTPEPASMLLLGTGLAAAWQARRLRRAR